MIVNNFVSAPKLERGFSLFCGIQERSDNPKETFGVNQEFVFYPIIPMESLESAFYPSFVRLCTIVRDNSTDVAVEEFVRAVRYCFRITHGRTFVFQTILIPVDDFGNGNIVYFALHDYGGSVVCSGCSDYWGSGGSGTFQIQSVIACLLKLFPERVKHETIQLTTDQLMTLPEHQLKLLPALPYRIHNWLYKITW